MAGHLMESVVAYCAESNGQYDIYTIAVDGGEALQLTNLLPVSMMVLEYSPDGKYIWFNSVRGGLMQVWRMEADGSNPTQMSIKNKPTIGFPVMFPPDNQWVVYIAYKKR
ncbi:MAG: PD40 domain-containing protein [Anaerolineales bacterium]|nr:PD40 domain-containing protein [Anaerolineales bacterium]